MSLLVHKAQNPGKLVHGKILFIHLKYCLENTKTNHCALGISARILSSKQDLLCSCCLSQEKQSFCALLCLF